MGGEFWALDTDAEVAACNGKSVGDDCYSGSVGCGTCTSVSDGETTVTVCRSKDCEHGCNESTHSCKNCTTTRDCGKCYTCDGGDCAPVYCEHGCDTSTGDCYGCTDDDDCPCGSKCKSGYCTEVPEACDKFGCHVATDTCNECMGGGSDTGCDGCSECKESGGSANKCARKAACEKYGSVTITDDAGNRTCKCKECESGESSDNGCTKCIGGFWEVQEGAGCDPGDGGCGACNSEGECIDKECELGCTESTHTCWECDENSVSTKDPDDVTNRCRSCDTDEHKWVKLNGQTLCGTCKDGTFTPVKGRNGCVECDAGGKATLLKNKTFDYGCSGCDAEGTYYRYGGDAREVACADDSGCFVCGSGAKCVRKVAGAEVLTSGGCSFCKATPSDYRHPDRPEGLYSFNGHCIYCDGGGTDLLDGGDGSGILDDCVECKDGVPVFHAGESCTDCYPRDGTSYSCLVCAADGYADVKSCGEGETLDTEDCTCRKDCGTCEKWDSTEKKCVADTSKNGEYECGTCADGVFTGGCGPCEKCEDGKTCVADTSKDGTSVGDECHACSGGVVKTYAGGYGCYSCDSDGNIKYADSGTACSHGSAARDCGRCDGSGTCQPYTGPGATTCYTCEAGEAVYAEEGTACGDGDCSKCDDSGYCRAPVVSAGTGVIDKCNTCEAGARKKNDDGPVECGTCADGVFTPSPEGTEEGKCYTCDGKGNKVKKDDGTPCGDCNWCVDGECTPTAEGDFDACNTCDGKGNKVPKSYGTVCSGGCGLCDADGKCVEDSSKSGKQVGDSCQVCEGGAPVSKDSICGDCRTCNSGGKCENKPDGVLDKCNTCTGGVKKANADGALKCGTCKDGTFTAAADGTAVDRCTVCKGGEPTAIYDSGSTPSVFDDCTYCDGMTLETMSWKDECIDCTSGTPQNINEGESCAFSASKCGVCSAGDCVDKTCPAGQELNTETCTCGECKYGYNNATNDCYECDPDSSGTSTCGTCKRCESGMCVADSSAKPECGTCSEGVFTPSKAGTVVDECNTCDGKGNKVQKADDTPCGDGTGCSKCKSGECKPANDGGTCATCRKCSGGACVADSSLNETRIGETCQACVAGSPKDYDGFCGPCEKCSGGKCVADESKNGPAATADLGETVCGTCKAGKLVKDDSACPCGTCGDDGKCHPDKSKDGLTCGECGECKDGACVGDPLLKDSQCHSGCGKCDSSGYCVADDSKDGETCGDGCSSCQDGECTVDSAKDGSACSSDGSGCGICSGGECTTDDEKSGQECNGGCGTCKGTACSVTVGKEGEACAEGCGSCHNGLCLAASAMAGKNIGPCRVCEGGRPVAKADGTLTGKNACGSCRAGVFVPSDANCGKCGECTADGVCKAVDGKCGKCETCSADDGYTCTSLCTDVTCADCAECNPCTGACECTGPGKCKGFDSSGNLTCLCVSGVDCGCGLAGCVGGVVICDCGDDPSVCVATADKSCAPPGCESYDCGACGHAYKASDGTCKCDCSGDWCESNGAGKCQLTSCADKDCGPCGHGVPDGKGGCKCDCADSDCTDDGSGKCKWTPCNDKSLDCGCGKQVRSSSGICVCSCGGTCYYKEGSASKAGTCSPDGKGCKCGAAPEPDPTNPEPEDDQTPTDDDTDESTEPDCNGKTCGCGTLNSDCTCTCPVSKGCVPDHGTCVQQNSKSCKDYPCGDCGYGVPDGKGGCKCYCRTGGCTDGDAGKCKRISGCKEDKECGDRHCDTTWKNGLGRCVDCTKEEHCSNCGGGCDTTNGTCRAPKCNAGETCDPKTGECYVCRRTSQCPSGICDTNANGGKGKCVACTDSDTSKCPTKCHSCSDGACTGGCEAGQTCDESKTPARCRDDACDGKEAGDSCGDCKYCNAIMECVSKCKEGEACVDGPNGKECGTCANDAQCQEAGTKCAKCNRTTHECEECADGLQCLGDDSTGYACGTCARDSDCTTPDTECMGCETQDDGTRQCGPADRLCAAGTCSDAGRCVECESDAKCQEKYGNDKPYCEDNKCTPCREGTCPSGKVCKPGVGCVECLDTADCGKVNACATCDPSTNECRDVCKEKGEECRESDKTCVECTGDNTCRANKGNCWSCNADNKCEEKPCATKVCDDDGDCVTCGPEVHADNQGCSREKCEECRENECVDWCADQDRHCDGHGHCYECTENSHCSDGFSCIDHECRQCSDTVKCADACETCEYGVCVPKTCPEGTHCNSALDGACTECAVPAHCAAKGMSVSCADCSGGHCSSNCPYGADCTSVGCKGDKECNEPADCNGRPCIDHKCLHDAECTLDRDCGKCRECKAGKCGAKECEHGCNAATGNCNCARRTRCGVCGSFDDATCACACWGSDPVSGAVCVQAGRGCTYQIPVANNDYWDDGRGGWDGPTEDIV